MRVFKDTVEITKDDVIVVGETVVLYLMRLNMKVKGFAPAMLEADLESLYDFALASIVGPSLEDAEADFRTGQTFTLEEWLEDSDENA